MKSRVGGVDEWVKEMVAWRQLYLEGQIFGVERDEAWYRIDQIERCLRKMRDFDGIDMGDADLTFLDIYEAFSEAGAMSRESDGADMAALLVLNMRLMTMNASTVAASSIEARTDLAMVEGRHIRRLREDIQTIHSTLALYDSWLESVS